MQVSMLEQERATVISLQCWADLRFSTAEKAHPQVTRLIDALFQARNALESLQAEDIARRRKALENTK